MYRKRKKERKKMLGEKEKVILEEKIKGRKETSIELLLNWTCKCDN